MILSSYPLVISSSLCGYIGEGDIVDAEVKLSVRRLVLDVLFAEEHFWYYFMVHCISPINIPVFLYFYLFTCIVTCEDNQKVLDSSCCL